MAYLWSRVITVEGLEAILFDLGFGFPKPSLDDFNQSFLREVIFRKVERVVSTPRIFTEKFVADAERLNSPAHPGFNKIRAL